MPGRRAGAESPHHTGLKSRPRVEPVAGRLDPFGTRRHTPDVDEKPRYSLRRRSVALTRRQWTAVAVALAVAVAGLVVTVAVRTSAGIIVTGVATLTAILVVGFGRRGPDRS